MAERNFYGLTTNPIPPALPGVEGRGAGNEGARLSLGKKG